jgi:hypothetical protein
LGGRAHFNHAFFAELDGFVLTSEDLMLNPTTTGGVTYGMMFGVGAEGKTGAIVTAVEAGLGVAWFAFLVMALAHTH